MMEETFCKRLYWAMKARRTDANPKIGQDLIWTFRNLAAHISTVYTVPTHPVNIILKSSPTSWTSYSHNFSLIACNAVCVCRVHKSYLIIFVSFPAHRVQTADFCLNIQFSPSTVWHGSQLADYWTLPL